MYVFHSLIVDKLPIYIPQINYDLNAGLNDYCALSKRVGLLLSLTDDTCT